MPKLIPLVTFASMLVMTIGCQPKAETPTPAVETDIVGSEESVASKAPTTIDDPNDKVPFTLEEGFQMLALADFESFGAESTTWEKTDEGLKCSGKPRGYLYSKQPFRNFTLRLDYRFTRPADLSDESKFKGNSGFMVYITGEHKIWPMSLEVQGKHVQMATIKENGGAEPATVKDDDSARLKARHPVGHWNSLEIVSKEGALTVTLNGTPVSSCEPDFISEGPIGIQAEDHPFEVRRIRIRAE